MAIRPPGPPRRRAAVCIMLLAAVIVTTAAISHVWTRMRAIECGYKISRESKRNAKLLEAHRRLRIEVALLKSPTRVARIAVDELGMHHPRPDQIRRLRTGAAAERVAISVAPRATPRVR